MLTNMSSTSHRLKSLLPPLPLPKAIKARSATPPTIRFLLRGLYTYLTRPSCATYCRITQAYYVLSRHINLIIDAILMRCQQPASQALAEGKATLPHLLKFVPSLTTYPPTYRRPRSTPQPRGTTPDCDHSLSDCSNSWNGRVQTQQESFNSESAVA